MSSFRVARQEKLRSCHLEAGSWQNGKPRNPEDLSLSSCQLQPDAGSLASLHGKGNMNFGQYILAHSAPFCVHLTHRRRYAGFFGQSDHCATNMVRIAYLGICQSAPKQWYSCAEGETVAVRSHGLG